MLIKLLMHFDKTSLSAFDGEPPNTINKLGQNVLLILIMLILSQKRVILYSTALKYLHYRKVFIDENPKTLGPGKIWNRTSAAG